MKYALVAGLIFGTFLAQAVDSRAIISMADYAPSGAALTTTTEPRANVLASAKVGDEAVLRVSSGEVVICIDEKAYAEFLKLSVAQDYLGMAQMEQRGLLFTVASGTKAKVIGTGFEKRNVRIMNGKQLGRSGWVTASLVVL